MRLQQLHGLCFGGRQRPDHSGLVALRAAQGQQRQYFKLTVGLREPLQRLLTVRLCASHPRGQGLLLVGQGVERHAQFLAGLAVAALAHHGQFGVHVLVHALDGVLKIHRFAQHVFQHWHIDDVGQAVQRGRLKLQLATSVTPDLHGLHRCGVLRIRPAAQVT